jgi:hypothetical protein
MARNIAQQLKQQLDQVSSNRIAKYFRNIDDELKRLDSKSSRRHQKSRKN